MSVSARAPAKVNLHLGVGRPRADGFHPLVTIFHALELCDRVSVAPGPGRVTVAGRDGLDVSGVPLDASNIAARALAAVGSWPADLHLDKAIPVAGGMAGGSADAAAALVATDPDRAAEHAAELGSDVPFALLGGTAVGRGRGELLDPVAHPGPLHWVVVPAAGGLSTPAVYRRFDELHPDAPEAPAEPVALLASLRADDVEGIARHLHNDLQEPAVDLRPDLAETLAAGEAAGALRGIVSGSGPTCAFLCADEAGAEATAARLRSLSSLSSLPGPSYPALVTRGPAAGAELVEGLLDG